MNAKEMLRRVLEGLKEHGIGAWGTGGTVRDLILGMEPKDIDIVVDDEPEKAAGVISSILGVAHAAKINKTLGTLELRTTTTAPWEEPAIQISRLGKRPGAPENLSVLSVRMDADISTRDFTVNALMLGADGVVTDEVDGLRHLSSRVLHLVDGKASIEASPIRVLRAFRFIATHGFDVSIDTLGDLQSNQHLLLLAPREMWREEMTRLLMGANAATALRLMEGCGVLGYLLPETAAMRYTQQPKTYHRGDVWEHTVYAVTHAPVDPLLRWAAFLHDVAKPATVSRGPDGRSHFYHHDMLGSYMVQEIGQRFRFPDQFTQDLSTLVANHLRLVLYEPSWSDASVLRLDREFGPKMTDHLVDLARADTSAGSIDRVEASLARIEHFRGRLAGLRERRGEVKALLPSGIGRRIIEVLEIGEGPVIGQLKGALEDRIKRGDLAEAMPVESYDEAIRQAYRETTNGRHRGGSGQGSGVPGA